MYSVYICYKIVTGLFQNNYSGIIVPDSLQDCSGIVAGLLKDCWKIVARWLQDCFNFSHMLCPICEIAERLLQDFCKLIKIVERLSQPNLTHPTLVRYTQPPVPPLLQRARYISLELGGLGLVGLGQVGFGKVGLGQVGLG